MTSKSKKAISASVYKATMYKPKPSKEKHVRAIILRSFNKDGSSEEIIRCLSKRLEKQNWAVVLKCLMIFHRCFRDGDALFIDAMKARSNQIFALRHFSATAPANHLYTVFVKKYAKYLEEKVSVLRLLGFQFEKNKDAVKGLKPPKCFKIVPKLQSQLNALLNCKMRPQHVGNNQLIHRTYILLMKDSVALYSLLSSAVLQLIDMFWKMERKDATRVLAVYKLFIKETDALIGLYDLGKTFVRELPVITKVDPGIVDSMEKYIDSLPAGSDEEDEGGNTKKERRKSKGAKGKGVTSKTKKKDDSDDDSEEHQLTENNQDEYEYSGNDGDKSYEDSDKEKDDDESSSEGDEPADDNDWVKQYLNAPAPSAFPNAFANPGAAASPFAPSFGPGAQANPILISTGGTQQQQPNYNQKAAGILSVFDAPSPFQAGGGAFGQPMQQNANPFSAPASNPFGNQPAASPFGGGLSPFGASPFNATPAPANNNNIFGSQSGVGASLVPTGNNVFGNPGLGGNIYGSSSGIMGSGAGTAPNAFGNMGSGSGTAPNAFGNMGNMGATGAFGVNASIGGGASLGMGLGANNNLFGSGAGMAPANNNANIFGAFGTTNPTPSSSPFGMPTQQPSAAVNPFL